MLIQLLPPRNIVTIHPVLGLAQPARPAEVGPEGLHHGSGHHGRRESRLLDVYNERPVRLSAKVSIPVREHPKFNFVGKLLGPRGSSLKQLQEETMTKMAVLGRGSMRDKNQEEDLRRSTDPKHLHLREDLHVEITAFASPAEAHARLAYALTEVGYCWCTCT